MRKHIKLSAAALAAILATTGCTETTTPPPPEPDAIILDADDAIRIRMLLSVTVAPSLGAVSRAGAELAAEDMGPIHGREVELGDPVDTSCSPEGGRAGAMGIFGDPKVAGIIGTNCSAAAVAAAPVVSDEGLVMISPSNTSPVLTSDLAGNANADHHPGYFRTASNDLHQARALSDFVYNQLELRSVATVHDGDPVHLRARGSVRRCVLGSRGHRTVPGRNRKGPDRHDRRARRTSRPPARTPSSSRSSSRRDRPLCRPGADLRRAGGDDADFPRPHCWSASSSRPRNPRGSTSRDRKPTSAPMSTK